LQVDPIDPRIHMKSLKNRPIFPRGDSEISWGNVWNFGSVD
jgi:hypothetical protein